MHETFPVHVEVDLPTAPRFERVQLLLRVVLAIVLGWLGITAGWLALVLFGALPVIAAISISTHGPERYLTEVGPRLWRVLAWLMRYSAYMMLLVDRFPATAEDDQVHLDVEIGGHPTVGSALLRMLTSIPSGLVLGALWLVSGLVWLGLAFLVLVGAHLPRSLLAFQRTVLRWQTRLVAYHASLIDRYPPFALSSDDHHHHGPALADRR